MSTSKSENPQVPQAQGKAFDMYAYWNAVLRGGVNGIFSTTLTFFTADRASYFAQKLGGTYNVNAYAYFKQGNYSEMWKHSLYVDAYRKAWARPFKGAPVAYLNSILKNVILFPTLVFWENALNHAFPDSGVADKGAGFAAGLSTVYITSPMSVLKARLLDNETFLGFCNKFSKEKNITTLEQHEPMSYRRLMSGVNATAIRDGIFFGVYCYLLGTINNLVGEGHPILASNITGLIGTIPSNIFSVIALNQKISDKPMTMFGMGKQIYNQRGIRGFYPLMTLTSLSMIGRSTALAYSNKYYNEYLVEKKAHPVKELAIEEPSAPTPK